MQHKENMVQLKDNGVVFSKNWYEGDTFIGRRYLIYDEGGVVYYDKDTDTQHRGRIVGGITGILHDQLFQDDFTGIDKSVLEYAADRGSCLHEHCQAYDEWCKMANVVGGTADIDYIKYDENECRKFSDDINDMCDILEEYVALRSLGFGMLAPETPSEHRIKPVATEYMVTNGDYASAIDFVWEIGDTGKVILVDGKCTSKPNMEKTGWQLSIYKAWFEKSNPGIEVVGCCMLWFPMRKYSSEIKLIDLQSYIHGEDEVKYLLDCDKFGIQYVQRKEELPAIVSDTEAKLLAQLERTMKENKAKLDEIHKNIMERMMAAGMNSVDTEYVKVTITPETTTKKFDTTKFKKEHADLYNEYMTEGKRAASIRITTR